MVSEADGLGGNIDQMVLWPNDLHPTHLIACNEEGTAAPGIQRIRLSDGVVETILTGLTRCDPTRKTPGERSSQRRKTAPRADWSRSSIRCSTTNVVLSGTTLSGADARSRRALRSALGAFLVRGFRDTAERGDLLH